MPRLWWALTQDELPRPNGGLSKRIKYYILCLAYARSGGDALRERKKTRFKVIASYNILQYLCDFIHVLIFVIVSKCRKSPKLMNIVIHATFKGRDYGFYIYSLHIRYVGVVRFDFYVF